MLNTVFYGKTKESIGCSEECSPLDFGLASGTSWIFA